MTSMNAKGKFCIIIYLILVTISVQIDARMRAATSRSLQKIKTSLSSAGKNANARIKKIGDYLDSHSSQVDAISSSIEQIGEAVPKLTSGEAFEIVTGVMDLTSAVTSLIPVVGPIISTVFSLFSTIFSAIGGGSGQDMGSIVEKAIKDALNNFDDSNLRAEATGTARVYRVSQAYLGAKEGVPLNKHEVAAMAAHIPIYSGVKFLGILTSKIQDNLVSKDLKQVKRAMEYTKLYVTLAVLRSAVLWEMYSIVRATLHSNWTAEGIKRVADAEERRDKRFIQYLQNPQYSQAVFFSSFSISEWPEISKFLKSKGLKYQNLNNLASGSTHTLRPMKWTNWYMVMDGGSAGWMRGGKHAGREGTFYFDSISSVDNYFYLRPLRWPSWYVYMKADKDGNCRGWKGKPGPQGEWKVIQFQDGKYMISPRKWPNWFAYMKNDNRGTIRGWKGDPGKQGHWIID